MKRSSFIVTIFIVMIIMVGCAGAADYEAELINGFVLWRSYSESIFVKSSQNITIEASDNTISEFRVPPQEAIKKGEYLTALGHDERYILVKTNKNNYYILDTQEINVSSPLSKEEFDDEKEILNISKDVKLVKASEYK